MIAPVRPDDAYLPPTALAEYAGLSVRTLRGYLTPPAHPLPCYRIGAKGRRINNFYLATRTRSISRGQPI